MKTLVTGAGGFLAKELIPQLLENGGIVYGLYHRPPEPKLSPPCQILGGDITEPDLGLENVPPIDQVIHCAALLDLGNKRKDEIFKVNVGGTRNVIKFCKSRSVPLAFISTAYTQGRNYYEQSKEIAEDYIKKSGLKYTIFKPSILIGDRENPGTDQTINHIALSIAKIHHRAETTRRKAQDTLALPPLELGFRLFGNPSSTLNIIPVELVCKEMVSLMEAEGTYWITNPNPPLLQEVADDVGEALGLNIKILKEFRASPPERILKKLIAPFLPYMEDEPHFPTVVKEFKLPRGHIRDMVNAFLVD